MLLHPHRSRKHGDVRNLPRFFKTSQGYDHNTVTVVFHTSPPVLLRYVHLRRTSHLANVPAHHLLLGTPSLNTTAYKCLFVRATKPIDRIH